ncbi:MAG: hypothetical protein E7478_00940 [Ruminococcaceae bacterium]|nr:hypothetical protein [Oscillospiraceae bacterium]
MVLSLDYSDLKSAVSRVNDLKKELDQYSDDLSRKVQGKIAEIKGGAGSASYYVDQKIRKINEKSANASSISTAIDKLKDTAERVDNNVKKTIEANQKSFFKKYPDLKPSDWELAWTSFMCGLEELPLIGDLFKLGADTVRALDELRDNIKYWYHCEGGKELVGIVLSATGAVLSVVAVVLTVIASFPVSGILAGIVAVAGTVGAVIAAVNAVTNLITSVSAYDHALRNEHGMSKIRSDQDSITDWLQQTNFDSKFWNRFSNGLVVAIEITDTVCTLVDIADVAVKFGKSFKAKNLKKTFQALCQPRDSKGRFVKGKPSFWNGFKTVIKRFNPKEFLLNSLGLGDIADLGGIKKITPDAAKKLNGFIKGINGIVGDLDDLRSGKSNMGAIGVNRILSGLDGTLFPDRDSRIKGKNGEKLWADTTALKKLKEMIVKDVGIGNLITSDFLKSESIGKALDFKAGLIGNIKNVAKALGNVRTTGVRFGIPNVDGISAKLFDVDLSNMNILLPPDIGVNIPDISTFTPAHTGTPMPNPLAGGALKAVGNLASLPSMADFVSAVGKPFVDLPEMRIPMVNTTINTSFAGVLPSFEFNININISNPCIGEPMPFTCLAGGGHGGGGRSF